MKKWIAMIAALCMMILTVSAAGEETAGEKSAAEGPAGDWHMVLADVEFGVFRLGEDGTIWDLEYDNIYDDKLCDGSSVILKQNADSYVIKYCKEHGITLTQVEAVSWTRDQ